MAESEILEEEQAPETIQPVDPEEIKQEYPKSTAWADFDTPEGRLTVVKLNKDFTEFDVSFEDYFNGSDELNADEWQKVYTAVARECNKSGGVYTIDCWKNRYTVRKVADIEQIRYDEMTDEEKAVHDLQKKKSALEMEKAENQRWLKDHDYIGTKIITGRATVEEYAEEIAQMNTCAKRINDIDEELKTL